MLVSQKLESLVPDLVVGDADAVRELVRRAGVLVDGLLPMPLLLCVLCQAGVAMGLSERAFPVQVHSTHGGGPVMQVDATPGPFSGACEEKVLLLVCTTVQLYVH